MIESLYRTVNVDASQRLSELAVSSGVKCFVFVSSVKAGGFDDENVEIQPESVYGKTKQEAELKLLEIGRNRRCRFRLYGLLWFMGPVRKVILP